MTIQAVIFDMDGVLVDSEGYWEECRVDFARELGKNWAAEDQRLVMGRGSAEWAQIMRTRMALDMEIEEIISQMRARVLARYNERLPILPGALEAVHAAASRYKVALASGSPTVLIQHVTKSTGLDQVFQTMVFGDEVEHGKPAPDIYLEAARRLNVSPVECLGIEDSASGIRALKAAGMVAVAVPGASYPLAEDVLNLADLVLPSLEAFSLELVSQFDNLQTDHLQKDQ